jgi:predicted Zn-dependent protease
LPNFLEVNDTIGWIYLKKNIPESAVDEFRRLVAAAPSDPTYHYHYAMALKQKGDTADAKAQCEVALANRPPGPLEAQIKTLQASLN